MIRILRWRHYEAIINGFGPSLPICNGFFWLPTKFGESVKISRQKSALRERERERARRRERYREGFRRLKTIPTKSNHINSKVQLAALHWLDCRWQAFPGLAW